MTKLEVEEFEDIKSGYKIRFHFDENPYFENQVLEKEFHTGPSGESSSKSTEIKWKPESELARRIQVVNSQITPAGKGKRRYTADNPRTFFMWFTEQGESSSDDIADMIKDDMWPNPLQYFLVPDLEGENGGNVDDEEIEADEEDDEEDEEDDEEAEEAEEEDANDNVVLVDDDEDVDEGENEADLLEENEEEAEEDPSEEFDDESSL